MLVGIRCIGVDVGFVGFSGMVQVLVVLIVVEVVNDVVFGVMFDFFEWLV